MAVEPSVHNFLGVPKRSSGDRTLQDHLDPSRRARLTSSSTALKANTKISMERQDRRRGLTNEQPALDLGRRAPAPALAEVGKARASEARTVLTEGSPTTTLELPALKGALRVALVWKPQTSAAGLKLSSDIHLGGLWQDHGRNEGMLQAVGDRVSAPGYGARQVARMGAREEGREEMLVDTKHLGVFRRFFFYAYAARDEGLDWDAHAPELRIEQRGGATTVVHLELAPRGVGAVMAVSTHLVGSALVVRREDGWGSRTRDLAQDYGFDLPWAPDGKLTRS